MFDDISSMSCDTSIMSKGTYSELSKPFMARKRTSYSTYLSTQADRCSEAGSMHNNKFIGAKYFDKTIVGRVLVAAEGGRLGLLYAFDGRLEQDLFYWNMTDSPVVVGRDVRKLKEDVVTLTRTDVIEKLKEEAFEYIWFEGTAGGLDFFLQFVNNQVKVCTTKLFGLIDAEGVKKTYTRTKEHFRWMRIKHSRIGGLTNSSWLIAYPSSLVIGTLGELAPAYGLHRSFKEIPKHNVNGRTIHKEVELPDLVDLKDLHKQTFQIPSVFSITRCVERQLTNYELGCVLDVSERTSGILSQDDLAILLEGAPGKVCQVGVNMLLTLEHKVESPEIESGKTEEVSTISVTTSKENKRQRLIVDPANIQEDREMSAEELYLLQYGEKAAKNDDEEVPTFLWDLYLMKRHFPHISYNRFIHGRALEILRSKFFLLWWRRRLMKSFRLHLAKTYGCDWLHLLKVGRTTRAIKRKVIAMSSNKKEDKVIELMKDINIGMDGIIRVANGSWWKWDNGSTLFFWRWHESIRKFARDGFPCFIERRLPQYRKKQRVPSDKKILAQMKSKLENVVEKNYIETGKVKSLINCFPVPKGEGDIRLVYDGTKSGLNAAVWAPNFFLPSVDSLLALVDVDTWFADLDLGEMFLNYFMEPRLRPYTGVDLTEIFHHSLFRLWLRWGRLFMGYMESPFFANKFFAWTIDMIRGPRLAESNPFKWNDILVNLPGQANYNPQRPRICKLWNDKIAADISTYVDDVRPTGSSEDNCKKACSRIAQVLQYLGQQNAARKYRPPSKRPGPWCGSFVAVQDGSVWVYVSQEKWNKAKLFISRLLELLEEQLDISLVDINRKFLEKGRGFMVYFCRTYSSFTPFLKGIHLTLESWREDRDEDGWKEKQPHKIPEVKESQLVNDFDEELADLYLSDSDEEEEDEIATLPVRAPKASDIEAVKPVPRLLSDIQALHSLLKSETPPWRYVRGKLVLYARYGFGDASKEGFGASFELEDGKIWFRFGAWSSEEKENSSNFRELTNLVETMEERLQDPSFKGGEIFLFTDNSVAEAAFYKGTSSNKKLFELVLRMKKLELSAGCKIHLIHVAGTRMIAQGSDGLSRGDVNEGVMKGLSMLSFIPIHLSAIDRQPSLTDLISKTIAPDASQETIEFLSYEGWFERGHDIIGGNQNLDGVWTPTYKSGTFIWTPPPAAALIAVEQMRMARLKREDSTHVFIIPRLMTSEWKRQLFRASDLFLELPFDDTWPQDLHHEPLTIAFIFPFLSHSPWQLKRSSAFLGMESNFAHARGRWAPCQKVWCGKCYSAPKDLAFHIQKPENDVGLIWSKAGEESRFLVGMDGAQFVVPFQCDCCWFRNLEGRTPRAHSLIDQRYLGYIRRVNLDIIWSRAPGTISNSRQGIKLTVQMWKELGVTVQLPKLGPWKVEDNVGFRLAIACLRYSQRPGRNATDHLQYDAVRKLRTSYSNLFEASPEGFLPNMLSFRGQGGESLLLSGSPTESKLFNKFMRGLLLRMGRQTKVDFGLSIDILTAILDNLEEDLVSTEFSMVEKRYKTMLGNFLIIGFVCALRGNEGFMVEAHGLQSHIEKGQLSTSQTESHVVIPLLGRFKGEDGEGWHLMVSVSTTSSGLQIRKWIERLVLILKTERKEKGPAFCNVNGTIIDYWKMNDSFISELQRVQSQFPSLFEKNIEITESYSIYRSLRRGSTARATEAGVSEATIDLHNRWRSIEARRGQRSRKNMRDYYTDLKLTLKSRLSYSKAL